MLEAGTNFAYLMDLLGVRSVDLSGAVGADKTLVSRWRSGKRKLTPESHWVKEIAAFFAEVDDKRRGHALAEVLRAYYPTEPLDTREQKQKALERWLVTAGQSQAEYQKERTGVLGALMSRIEALNAPEPEPEEEPEPPTPENTVVYGVKGFRGSAMTYFDLVLNLPEPQEMIFVCPDGLDMITRDEAFAGPLMDKLMALFAAGHRYSVVVRTDYKVSDISAFSGRWLVAHLLGYIKSYYYNDFGKPYTEKMLIAVKDHMAGRVTGGNPGDTHGVYTTIHFDKPTVDGIYKQCKEYQQKSRQRFHYGFFEQPDSFLRSIESIYDQPCYLFARLPHFGVMPKEQVQQNFTLTEDEAAHALREFEPLFADPSAFNADATVRHIFCEDDIEEMLLKSRHVSWELTAMSSRRVFLTAQRLADQLVRIKALLKEYKNYEVCFLPDDVFKKLTMQIGVWGGIAAIGWVTQGKSTACTDFTNVGALNGFCGMVWDKIPGMAKGRNAANRKLNMWLKKAEKYGLDV